MKKLTVFCSALFCASIILTPALMAKSYKKHQSTSTYNTAKTFSLDSGEYALRDTFTMAAKAAGVNILLSKHVRGNTRVSLKNVSPMAAIKAIAALNSFKVVEYSRKHKLYLIVREGNHITPLKNKNNGGKSISISFKDVDIAKIFLHLAKAARINILLTKNLHGKVSIELKDVPPMVAMKAIAATYSFMVTKFDSNSNIYVVSRTTARIKEDLK